MAKLEEPFVLQLRIRFGDSVVADNEFLRQCSDAGKEIALSQNAGFNGMADLLHELQINGGARGGIEREEHINLYQCNGTVTTPSTPTLLRRVPSGHFGSSAPILRRTVR